MKQYSTLNQWAILMYYDNLKDLKEVAPEFFEESGELNKDEMLLFLVQVCYNLIDRVIFLEKNSRN